MTRTPFIAGNWKMNLDHLQAIALVQKLAWTLADARHDFAAVEVAVFPPFTDLRSVQTLVQADKLPIRYGAQDVSVHASGAYTGEVAGAFLARLDCAYVIVGHSERRQYHAETDEIVGAKARAAKENGIVPVICVGETLEQREAGEATAIPTAQLRTALASLAPGDDFVIAYEPVWAIGTGLAATADDAQAMSAALRATIADALGEETAENTRILYGGSVKTENAAGYLKMPDVDGALVGGASLDVDSFAGIVRFQKHVTF
ncbi:triose-phosphate isomerase [Gryllotalpicola sp.]|uniref:triose-phosphate isomerase n=1 Tax=Gryllotalpicola sp. TaxID=1932787 RepID=UPI00262C09C4|nr:triose-phosphate isomerase [Gryllotalpicola sp.]